MYIHLQATFCGHRACKASVSECVVKIVNCSYNAFNSSVVSASLSGEIRHVRFVIPSAGVCVWIVWHIWSICYGALSSSMKVFCNESCAAK